MYEVKISSEAAAGSYSELAALVMRKLRTSTNKRGKVGASVRAYKGARIEEIKWSISWRMNVYGRRPSSLTFEERLNLVRDTISNVCLVGRVGEWEGKIAFGMGDPPSDVVSFVEAKLRKEAEEDARILSMTPEERKAEKQRDAKLNAKREKDMSKILLLARKSLTNVINDKLKDCDDLEAILDSSFLADLEAALIENVPCPE